MLSLSVSPHCSDVEPIPVERVGWVERVEILLLLCNLGRDLPLLVGNLLCTHSVLLEAVESAVDFNEHCFRERIVIGPPTPEQASSVRRVAIVPEEPYESTERTRTHSVEA